MKTPGIRRALLLANVFNLLVGIYFIIISIISLVHLRWFHQLTMFAKVRHVFTTATSYFAFFILIFAAVLLIAIFVMGAMSLSPRTYISPVITNDGSSQNPGITTTSVEQVVPIRGYETSAKVQSDGFSVLDGRLSPAVVAPLTSNQRGLVLKDAIEPRTLTTNARASSSILLHLLTATSLVIIIVVWLLNAGELVRDSISTQLDVAFAKYQFANRSNHYSVAIDGMQAINNCCGSLDFTDFPRRRTSGLSSGQYPGSCCDKNIFGVNARVQCSPEEIVRARQTSGCVTVLANYFDLISILIVPVSLACLFVNITMIALIAISRGHQLAHETRDRPRNHAQRFELKAAA